MHTIEQYIIQKLKFLDSNIYYVSDFILKNNLRIKIKNRKLKLYDIILIVEKISNKNISINLKLIFDRKTFKKIIKSKFISNDAKKFIFKIIGIK